ncbi:uncharacterized protein [Amphiura filiformis]|uniref:uncharacterized protein n=1 Tax=Amphiura filiformis TaxID=82378 RepID=UPI003B21FFF3
MYRPVTEELGPDEPPDFSSDQEMDDDTTNNEISTDDSLSPQRMPYGDVDRIDAAVVDFSSANARTDAKRAQAKGRIFVQCDGTYLFTLPGIFKVFQLMATTAALLCVITMTYDHGGYLALPSAWRFRVFVFTSVVSLLVSVLVLVCRTTNLARLMPVNWILLDLMLSIVLALLYLISSSMVANAYIEFADQLVQWESRDRLLAGVLLSFCCCILYSVHSVFLFWRYNRSGHFRHRLLQRSGSTQSDIRNGSEPDVIT